jgi:hypothetical protein
MIKMFGRLRCFLAAPAGLGLLLIASSLMDAPKPSHSATVTPFNGEHNAGIQVLNACNFPDDHGPLRSVNP